MAVVKLIFVVAIILQVVWCRSNADRHGNVGIRGGHQIGIEQAPFMASLRVDGTHHWCGGSIIHEQFILTAAHCIEPNRKFKILVGTDKVNGDGELYDIEEIKIHDRYNSHMQEFDVSLIKLKKPLIFGPKVAKVNLANANVVLMPGTYMNVTGWGKTGPYAPGYPNLLQVQIPLIKNSVCKYIYSQFYKITWNMLCAASRGRDSCQQGDSGSPLTLGNIQVGIASHGNQCGNNPSIYAKVSSALPWIQKEMNSHQLLY